MVGLKGQTYESVMGTVEYSRKMLARYGQEPVARALEAVERKQPADPAAYFAACLEKPSPAPGRPAAAADYSGPAQPLTDELRKTFMAGGNF